MTSACWPGHLPANGSTHKSTHYRPYPFEPLDSIHIQFVLPVWKTCPIAGREKRVLKTILPEKDILTIMCFMNSKIPRCDVQMLILTTTNSLNFRKSFPAKIKQQTVQIHPV